MMRTENPKDLGVLTLQPTGTAGPLWGRQLRVLSPGSRGRSFAQRG